MCLNITCNSQSCLRAVSPAVHCKYQHGFSALRALESVTPIRIPDYRPTCSCVFDLLIKHQNRLRAVGLGFIANLNIPGS